MKKYIHIKLRSLFTLDFHSVRIAQLQGSSKRQTKMSAVNRFLSPSMENLFKRKKKTIVEIGKKSEVDIRKTMRRKQLVIEVADHMIDNAVFDEETFHLLSVDMQELSQAKLEFE